MDDPRVLVTSLTRDDAAVYRVSADRAIVATVDYFTPIVDDAYTFGAVAAANAFSDLYAMGATPLFALNLVAWPREPEMLALLGETIRGSADVGREAGVFVLGGHSIDDKEPKFGMVAIGEARPDELFTNAGARPGDRLLLTKPLGTGILSTGLKQELIDEAAMEPAVRAMTTLNAGALRAARRPGITIHAATDVTGYGLVGHLHNILTASGVGARLFADAVPVFDRVRELVGQRAVPGGTERNVEAAAEYTRWHDTVDEVTRVILCDAQTSGGLLFTVPADDAEALVAALREERTPAASVVGEIVAGRGVEVVGAGG